MILIATIKKEQTNLDTHDNSVRNKIIKSNNINVPDISVMS